MLFGFGDRFRPFVSIGSIYFSTGLDDDLPLVIDEWNHVAFAYQYTGETLDMAVYLNFKKAVTTMDNSTLTQEIFPERYMGGGTSFGFGILDELTIFPEFLSESQIAQLNQTFPDM